MVAFNAELGVIFFCLAPAANMNGRKDTLHWEFSRIDCFMYTPKSFLYGSACLMLEDFYRIGYPPKA